MSGLVQRVRAKVDNACVVTEMDKEGCSVSLDGAPVTRLIVDLDEPGSPLGQNVTRCDYLFFADDNSGTDWVAPLELKRGQFHTVEFRKQLQAGAHAAEQLVPPNASVRFRPIAVFGGGLHKAEQRRLKQPSNRVRFHGRCEPLRLIRCGAKLTDELR